MFPLQIGSVLKFLEIGCEDFCMASNDLIDRIEAASAYELVGVVNKIVDDVLGTGISITDLHTNLPINLKAQFTIDDLKATLEETGGETLSETESAAKAKEVLLAAAPDPQLSRLLEAALETYEAEDTRMNVGSILATGSVLALLMLVATTEIEIEVGPVRVQKHQVTPEQIHAFEKIISSFKIGIEKKN